MDIERSLKNLILLVLAIVIVVSLWRAVWSLAGLAIMFIIFFIFGLPEACHKLVCHATNKRVSVDLIESKATLWFDKFVSDILTTSLSVSPQRTQSAQSTHKEEPANFVTGTRIPHNIASILCQGLLGRLPLWDLGLTVRSLGLDILYLSLWAAPPITSFVLIRKIYIR